MEKMEIIEKIEKIEFKNGATNLQITNRDLRMKIKTLMRKWAEISQCGETIRAETPAYIDEEYQSYDDTGEFYLHAGSEQILIWNDLARKYDHHSDDEFFTEIIPASDLRKFVKNFPQMAKEILEKMEKNNSENIDAIASIEKFLK